MVFSCLTLTEPCSLIFVQEFLVCMHRTILKRGSGTHMMSFPFKKNDYVPKTALYWS